MPQNIPDNMKLIKPDDKAISYMGRIDFSNSSAPKIIYAGSCISMKFIGTCIKIQIINHKFFNTMEIGFLIDGKQDKITFEHTNEPVTLAFADGLEEKAHEVIIFKRQDASHYFEFLGFLVNKNAVLLEAAKKPSRRIECFGDSVSAGAVSEAVQNTGKCDPDDTQGVYDNAWYSYSMITARNLGAEINDNAQGGIALFDGTGYYHAPTYIGMESTYDKLCYFPEGPVTKWDFSKYTPHVVIMAIGQNDPHNEGNPDNDITDPEFRKKWLTKYTEILRDLRSHYNSAVFILITTVLFHSVDWDNAIEEAKQTLADEGFGKIYHYMFKRNGAATPGHPRIPEQYEMAEELTSFISSLGDEIWT